jgi:hypothetical protein
MPRSIQPDDTNSVGGLLIVTYQLRFIRQLVFSHGCSEDVSPDYRPENTVVLDATLICINLGIMCQMAKFMREIFKGNNPRNVYKDKITGRGSTNVIAEDAEVLHHADHVVRAITITISTSSEVTMKRN